MNINFNGISVGELYYVETKDFQFTFNIQNSIQFK